MEEENKPINEQIPTEDLQKEIETYAFFSNPVKTNITLYNGMQLILKKLAQFEEKLDNLEKSLHGNQK